MNFFVIKCFIFFLSVFDIDYLMFFYVFKLVTTRRFLIEGEGVATAGGGLQIFFQGGTASKWVEGFLEEGVGTFR